MKLKTVTAVLLFSSVWPSLSVAQEREWQLDAQGEDTFLIFGVPNTADMGLSLWCKLGEKTISIFAPVPHTVKSANAKVALKIGEVEYPLQPKFNVDPAKPTLEAEMKPQDEIMSALASAQSIGLHIADHTTIFPTAGANFYEFNKLCTNAPVSN